MANAIWSKDGESFFETDDTPEYQEQAKSKNYTRYYDITKDDANVYRVTADRLEEAKGKGYKIFGQPAIEQQPKEEPGVLGKAADWVGQAKEAAVEAIKGAPAGLYQLGKEVATKPADALSAALTGTAKTFGVGAVGGALRGGYEAGKALLTGEEVEPAFKRGYEAEVSGLEERAKKAKELAPISYGAGPYAATAIAAGATGGASLPVMAGLETATGAAQQLAETGKIDTAQLAGQAVGGGVLMGAPAAVKAGLKGVTEGIPTAMKRSVVESVPETLKPAAAKMAESPQALEQYGTAKYELKRPGGLEEQWKQQQDVIKDATEQLKKTRTEDAANALSDAINSGLEKKRKQATKMYDDALKSVVAPFDLENSQINTISKMHSEFPLETKGVATNTYDALSSIIQDQQSTAPGEYTVGKEFQHLVKLDQALSSDINKLVINQQIPGRSSPVASDSIARLQGLKQEVTQRINNMERNLPEGNVKNYNNAKDAYAKYAQARDDFDKAGLLSKQNIRGKRREVATAERAAKALSPKIEDYRKTADLIDALQKLPEDETGALAIPPEQFTELKQQATGKIPEEQIPITPEQAALKQEVGAKRAQAAEYAELSKPRQEFTPGVIGLVQKAAEKIPIVKEYMGGSPVTRISRAQAVEQAFKVPGLSFAIKVLENANKPITSAMIRSLARQHNVDPAKLENVLAQQQTP